MTPSAETLLQKGRRLTEHTLDTCQLKRIKAAAVSHTQPDMPAPFCLYFAFARRQMCTGLGGSLCCLFIVRSGFG